MRESTVCRSAPATSSCSQIEKQDIAVPAVRVESDRDDVSVLLVAEDGDAERSILRSLKNRSVTSERARSVAELKMRVIRDDLAAPVVVFLDLELPGALGEEWVCMVRRRFTRAAVVAFGENLSPSRAARLLGFGVPSLHKPVEPLAYAHLALELCASRARRCRERASVWVESAGGGIAVNLDLALESYAAVRALSNQQRLILRFYLSGENDKEIARTLLCSEATVYEHWRRMGKKAGGVAKSTVISDFHRFLVRN